MTKATNHFDEFAHNDEAFEQFKQSDMMAELAKEPQSRDETKMDGILGLFKNLRFWKQFGPLESKDIMEFAQSIKLTKVK